MTGEADYPDDLYIMAPVSGSNILGTLVNIVNGETREKLELEKSGSGHLLNYNSSLICSGAHLSQVV